MQNNQILSNTNQKLTKEIENAHTRERVLVNKNKKLQNEIETADNDFRLLVSEAICLQKELENSNTNNQNLQSKNNSLKHDLHIAGNNNKQLLTSVKILKQNLAITRGYNQFLVKKNNKELKSAEKINHETTKNIEESLFEALEENQTQNIKTNESAQEFELSIEERLQKENKSLVEDLKSVSLYNEILLHKLERAKEIEGSLESAALIINVLIKEKSSIFTAIIKSNNFEKDDPDLNNNLLSVLNTTKRVQRVLRFLAQVSCFLNFLSFYFIKQIVVIAS